MELQKIQNSEGSGNFERCTLRSKTVFDNWKSFKNDEKYSLLHLKSSFCS